MKKKIGYSHAVIQFDREKFLRQISTAGKNEKDYQEIDVLDGVLADLRLGWTRTCYLSQNLVNEP